MTEPRRLRNIAAQIALTPAWLIVAFAYVGTVVWTIVISFTSSKSIPSYNFVGWAQYARLFSTDRWYISINNIIIFGVLFLTICLVIGFLLAVALDQKIMFENSYRTVILYPYAMSFVVTGLIWQWMLNPALGIEKTVQALGFPNFSFDWIIRTDMAIYTLVIAGVWQASGLVMALMLAGLRGVDGEIWKAARVDGIPAWRVYLFIIVPILRPMIVTAVVLLSIGVVKAFDLVVALTKGGPGLSTEVPAKFVMDNLFLRANIGLATAASTVMLVTVLAVLVPWFYTEYARRNRGGHA
ncbi:carbohydrate ABC transporter permease [Radicibacter daui]|uniref:carbohydrate ABC transporter permease n=1 Tax=Radicibacter daui TaxID=3064829 RepID=UPI0040469D2E